MVDAPFRKGIIVIRFEEKRTMEWTTPQFEEIALNCEINSYANAQL